MTKPIKFIPHYNKSLGYWSINIPPSSSKTGKRSHQYFKDLDSAHKAPTRLRERHRKFGVSLSNLDAVRLGEASEAYKLLKATGKPYNLLAIVREWIHQQSQKNRSVTFLELFGRYLESISHRSHIYKQQTRSVCTKLPSLHKRIVSEIDSADIEAALNKANIAAGTRNRFLGTLIAAWKFAIRKEWASANVAQKLDMVPMPPKPIETYSNSEVKGMLDLALKEEIDLLPYFSLGFLAGLRSNSPELLELKWDDIHFDENEIAVPAGLAKNKQRRFIKISPNLKAWLQAYINAKSEDIHTEDRIVTLTKMPLCTARSKILRKVLGKEDAKFIPSGMRNTFASNHLAYHNDINRLVLEMGHKSGTQELFDSYHLHTRRDDAVAFWEKINPPTGK